MHRRKAYTNRESSEIYDALCSELMLRLCFCLSSHRASRRSGVRREGDAVSPARTSASHPDACLPLRSDFICIKFGCYCFHSLMWSASHPFIALSVLRSPRAALVKSTPRTAHAWRVNSHKLVFFSLPFPSFSFTTAKSYSGAQHSALKLMIIFRPSPAPAESVCAADECDSLSAQMSSSFSVSSSLRCNIRPLSL